MAAGEPEPEQPQAVDLQDWVTTGRTGRRNALPDIVHDPNAAVGTKELTEHLERLLSPQSGLFVPPRFRLFCFWVYTRSAFVRGSPVLFLDSSSPFFVGPGLFTWAYIRAGNFTLPLCIFLIFFRRFPDLQKYFDPQIFSFQFFHVAFGVFEKIVVVCFQYFLGHNEETSEKSMENGRRRSILWFLRTLSQNTASPSTRKVVLLPFYP